MNFAKSCQVMIESGNGNLLAFTDDGQVRLYGISGDCYPSGAVVNELEEYSTKVFGWHIPNECFEKVGE